MIKRVIPILLVENGELIKTVKFDSPKYIGDLLNSVKIYNELEVDELCVLDKSAKMKGINFELIKQFVNECFSPVSYGGGIKDVNDIEKILKIGVEKVIICSSLTDYSFIENAVKTYGSSTIVACIDYKLVNDTRIVFNGDKNNNLVVEELIKKINQIGVGEIILQSIDRDGTYLGYDLNFIKEVISTINNPIVVAGGCKDLLDIKEAFLNGVSGAAAGSLFVYYTNAKGILINYPNGYEFEEVDIKR
jgi:cyclase